MSSRISLRVILQVPLILPVEIVSKLSAIGGGVAPYAHQGRQCNAMWPTLAAFQILLSRYSRQDDITIGVPGTAEGKEVRKMNTFKMALAPQLSSFPHTSSTIRLSSANGVQCTCKGML